MLPPLEAAAEWPPFDVGPPAPVLIPLAAAQQRQLPQNATLNAGLIPPLTILNATEIAALERQIEVQPSSSSSSPSWPIWRIALVAAAAAAAALAVIAAALCWHRNAVLWTDDRGVKPDAEDQGKQRDEWPSTVLDSWRTARAEFASSTVCPCSTSH